VYVCVCARARACVAVCVCVCACMRAYARARACVCMPTPIMCPHDLMVTHRVNFTKHKHPFLLNDQLDAQFFSMYLFIFLTLYTFPAHRAHHQERQTVSIQPLVAVTLCRWPCRVQVGSELPICTRHCHRHRVTDTRGCIDTICLS